MKKIILWLLSGLMTFGVMPLPVYAASDYLWLEAEQATFDTAYHMDDNAEASGEKLLTLYTKNAPPNEGYNVEFPFTMEKSGNYDIWILASLGDSNNYTKYDWSLDDSSPLPYIKSDETRPLVYQHKLAFVKQNVNWSRIAQGVSLTEGEHNFKILANKLAAGGTRSYFTLLDSIVIVPSSYTWQPEGDLQKPEKSPQRFAVIELERPSNTTRLSQVNSVNASGEKMLYAYDLAFDDEKGGIEDLQYSFSTGEDGLYDIWYLGSGSNAAAAHLSGMFWGIDEHIPDSTKASDRNENPQSPGTTIMQSAGATSEIPLYWQKLGTQSLKAGTHSLNLTYVYRALNGNEKFVLWADCALVIPQEWGWTPPTETENPNEFLPDFSIGKLDGTYIKEKYFQGDYSALTDSLAVPDGKLKTPGGSTISFKSTNAAAMQNDGQVNRPYFNQEDAIFDFQINATRNKRMSSTNIPVKVLKFPKYSCSQFKLVDESQNPITVLKDGETILAQATLKLNADKDTTEVGTGMILLAYYDENGILCKIVNESETITANDVNIVAKLELPTNVNGGMVKAYLLNGLQLANRLSNTIVIK